ncbi:MAG: DUF1570 domain-containing protein [Phycisphaerales bacterium JB063]
MLHRLTLPLIALLAVLLPAVQLSATPVVTQDGASEPSAFHLTSYRSHHYLIHTNLTREETVPFGRHMDAVFEQYQQRFSGFIARELDPMPLYLLRTREDYIRFMAEHDIDATNSGGLFFVTHALQGLATWAESGSRQRAFRVLQHEGFHQFAWNYIGPNLPVWLNEGLAQYFEDAVMVDGRMSAGLTHRGRIERVRSAIEGGHAMSLGALNAVSSRAWNLTLRQQPEHATLLYAQSWSVVYYLIHGDDGAHQDRLIDYLKLLNQGNGADEAMLLAFGREGFVAVQQGWRRFAREQVPDDLAAATERLEFLGHGLRLLNERGGDMPESIDELRDILQAYGFRTRRMEMGVTRQLEASDDALFTFARGSETGRPYEATFRMLAPSRDDLPPRIVAPGLSPEPTLIWYRDADGTLVQDIAYR